MKLKNLNGWQRLGILLSAIWLVVVVFMAISWGMESANALLLWIVPPFLVYLLCRGVGWVWRGFKLKGESNE